MSTFVLMGVSGAGKSTIGRRAARLLEFPFFEGDRFHPPGNVAKMSSGIPLTDADRAPWVDALSRAVRSREARHAVVACSALSAFVQNRLRESLGEPVRFLLLTADPSVIERRLATRRRHFMKRGMLESQWRTLQIPDDAVVIDVDRPPALIVGDVVEYIRNEVGKDPE